MIDLRGPWASQATWTAVEDGFFVASRDGEYLGYVERTADGHIIGFDGRSTPVGRYDDLPEAQRAVEGSPTTGASALSPQMEGVLHKVATASGAVALVTLAAAVVALPGL